MNISIRGMSALTVQSLVITQIIFVMKGENVRTVFDSVDEILRPLNIRRKIGRRVMVPYGYDAYAWKRITCRTILESYVVEGKDVTMQQVRDSQA